MISLVKNIKIKFLEQSILGLNIFITILFVRYLGPDKYGLYSYYTSIAYLVSILTFGALNPFIISEVAKGYHDNNLITGMLFLNIIGFFLILLSITTFYYFMTDDSRHNLVYFLIIALSSLVCLKDTFSSMFLAKQRMVVLACLGVFMFLISGALNLFGIFSKQSIDYFFYIIAVNTIATVALYGSVYFYCYGFIYDKIFKSIKYLIIQGWPLLITNISVLVFMRMDQIMLFYIKGESYVGIYSSTIWLMEKLLFFIPIILIPFFPYLAKQYNKDKNQYFYAVNLGFKTMSLFVVPIVIYTMFFGDQIMTFIFGSAYTESGSVLRILIISLIFIYWGALNQKILVMTGYLKLDLFFAATSAVLNVILNLILIPDYGVIGAAISTVIAHSLFFWVQMGLRNRKIYNRYMIQSVFPPLLVSLILVFIVAEMNLAILPQVIVYFSLYTVVIYLISYHPMAKDYARFRGYLQNFY